MNNSPYVKGQMEKMRNLVKKVQNKNPGVPKGEVSGLPVGMKGYNRFENIFRNTRGAIGRVYQNLATPVGQVGTTNIVMSGRTTSGAGGIPVASRQSTANTNKTMPIEGGRRKTRKRINKKKTQKSKRK